MLGKTPFRWFLYVVATLVVLKLCYNLGYRAANRRLRPSTEAPRTTTGANRQGQGLRGVVAEPADSAAEDSAPITPNP